MSRQLSLFALLILIVTVAATPALADVAVSVQNPQFSWSGKSNQRAEFRWSATIDNPASKDLRVRVTLELLDGAGTVVGTDTVEVNVLRRNRAAVDETGTIDFATAQRARQYRIAITPVRR